MTTKQKVKLAFRFAVLAVIIWISVIIGQRHGFTEGFVCFMLLGWLYDVR